MRSSSQVVRTVKLAVIFALLALGAVCGLG
jgi:hypothetical protein